MYLQLTPNLQLKWFAIDCDDSYAKFHANCEIMGWLEAFVGEL